MVAGGAGAYPSRHWARSREHPGQVTRLSQGHTETNNHAHLLKDHLESPINITCMFLGGGRKPEYPERTHTYTGRTCKRHTERPQLRFKPGTLLLWGKWNFILSLFSGDWVKVKRYFQAARTSLQHVPYKTPICSSQHLWPSVLTQSSLAYTFRDWIYLFVKPQAASVARVIVSILKLGFLRVSWEVVI